MLINKASITSPTYQDTNELMAIINSSLTSCCRFPSPGNSLDLLDLQTNLVPFPKAIYMVPAMSPIMSRMQVNKDTLNCQIMTNEALTDANSRLFPLEMKTGLYVSCGLFYQGNLTMQNINKSLSQITAKKALKFCDWLTTGFKTSLGSKPTAKKPIIDQNLSESKMKRSSKIYEIVDGYQQQVISLSNNSGFSTYLAKTCENFNKMVGKQAFVHWYLGEGTEEAEFMEACSACKDLEQTYRKVVT